MRFKTILAAMAVLSAAVLAAPASAQAGWIWSDLSDGWGTHRTTTHRAYTRRDRQGARVHAHRDPYAYRYEPRRYYTNSSSRYWRPAHKVHRHHKILGRYKYSYHPAWGYKKSRKSRRYWSR